MVRLTSIPGAMLIVCCAAAGACVTSDAGSEATASQQQSVVNQDSALLRDANGNVVATVVFTAIGNGCAVARWKNKTLPACPSPPPVCF